VIDYEYLNGELMRARVEIRLLKEQLADRPTKSTSRATRPQSAGTDLSTLIRELKTIDPGVLSHTAKIKELVSRTQHSFEKVIWFLLQWSDPVQPKEHSISPETIEFLQNKIKKLEKAVQSKDAINHTNSTPNTRSGSEDVAISPEAMIKHNRMIIVDDINEAELKEWRGKHQGSAMQLTYGSPDDFKRGLEGLVGRPTPKADDFEEEMRREHEEDELKGAFMAWPNPCVVNTDGTKLCDGPYKVTPTDELSYCQGHAKLGGSDDYRDSLKAAYGELVADKERDIGHENWPREKFLLRYVEILCERNSEIHAHNKTIDDGTTQEEDRSWERQENTWKDCLALSEQMMQVETWRGDALVTDSKEKVWMRRAQEYNHWLKVREGLTNVNATAKNKAALYDDFQQRFNKMYEELKQQTRGYNKDVIVSNEALEAAKEPTRMQSLLLPELTRLEVLGLRLYTGPMYEQHGLYTVHSHTHTLAILSLYSHCALTVLSLQVRALQHCVQRWSEGCVRNHHLGHQLGPHQARSIDQDCYCLSWSGWQAARCFLREGCV
jgi:hypothetical protein